jgi:hypothetical protein
MSGAATRKPAAAIAVAEHHQWTFALFEQEYLDPVGGNGA